MAISLAVRKQPSDLTVSKTGFRLVVGFEGLHLRAYADPASKRGRAADMKPEERPAGWETFPGDPWTIGYGRAHGVKEGDTCTLAQADAWLAEDLETAASKVRAEIIVSLTQDEFDALVSLVYNLGYIPKSMKACLNGGVTDKGVQMQPGSYGAALKQFPRNCRAAGIPMRGLLRRRLAEACVFSGLPWEAACSKNLVRLTLDAKGDPDPEGTTSLEETLIRARMDIPSMPIQRPDVSDAMKAPWPTTTTVITDTPASPVAPADMAGQPESRPPAPAPAAPAPEQKPAAPVPKSPSAAGPAAGGSNVPPPVSSPKMAEKPKEPEKPKAPVVITPKAIDPKSIPYGDVDPTQATNMSESRRVAGMVVVGIGSITQILAAREIVSSSFAAVFYDMSRDPIIVALVIGGAFWIIGKLTRKRGTQIVAKGMAEAKTVLK